MIAVKLVPNIIIYGTVNSAREKSRRRQWQQAGERGLLQGAGEQPSREQSGCGWGRAWT